jgi:hypothetical protein
MDKMSALSAKTANDIKRSLERIAVAGVAMAGAIATGTVAMIKGALDSADAMGKMAQAAGTTVETLSTLNYAASLSNVATETLVKGLEKLSLSAFKAQNGNVALERVYGRLGISVLDSNGKLKDSGILMEQVAVKFAKMGDSAGKTALAQQIFGKAGAALIPMLNQYGAEQEKVNDEAHRFGLVLSTSTVEVAMRAHDNLDRLGLALKGIGFSVLSATLPALDALLEKLINLAKNSNLQGLAAAFGQKVTSAVNLLGDALDFAVKHATALKLALEALAAVKIGTIALPIIADLAGGGIANVGKGLDKATLGMLGFERAATALPKIGKAVGGVATTYYDVAKGANFATVASLGLETGFGSVGKAITSLSFASVFASLTGGVGKAVASLKALNAASMFEGLTGALSKIPAFFGAIATGALNASKAMMLAALSNPWTAAALAIVGLAVLIYKFRDATFSLGGTTYKLRDTWNAAWIAMGWGLSWIGKQFSSLIGMLKSLWSGLIGFFANSSVVQVISDVFGSAFEWIQSMLGKLTPQWVTKALDEAKKQRVAKETPPPALNGAPKPPPGLPPPDTSGMGKQTESPVDKVLANLQEKLDESKQTLAAAGLEEEAQRKVAAANKASNEIMKLGQEIAKQTGATTKDYASLVDASTQAIIREKNAQISDIDAKTVLLNLMGNSARASALSIAQSGLMVQAMDKGSDAILRQAARTQAWNELRAKGASVTEILARSEQIYAESIAKESQAVQGNIITLQQELAARQIVNEATLGSLQAQDEAALRAKLYAIDVQIAGAATGELKDKLLALRDAMIAVNDEEKLKQDLDNARALKSPAEQYALEQEKLVGAVEALRKMQGGIISYGQSLQIAMKDQENFNRLIDETVKSLLFEGTAADGMKAFFLDMQKQAITAGQIIYDALHQAFSKISDNLTQLVTGGKTSFAQMFQEIGRQMVNSSIQSAMQKGLGALGKILPASIGGPLTDALKGKPDGSRNNPFHVIAEGGGLGGSQSNPLSGLIGAAGGPGGKGGLGGVGGSALGVGTGVMGTGVTSLGGLFGGRGGDVDGLAVRSPVDLLGGWSPGDGEGGGAVGGGLGDAITGIGPDQNDSEGGGGGGGGGGGVGGALGGLVSMLGGIFGGGKKTKPDGSQNNPLFVHMAGGGSLAGSSGGILDALGGGTNHGDGESGGGESGGGGGGAAGLSAITGMIGSLVNLFSGSNKNSTASKTFTFLGSLVSSFSGLIPHADGGPISGPGTGTSDSIPARLSNGEFVVRATPAAKYKGLLQHINKGGNVHKTQGFASGGWVGYADGGTVTAPSSAYTMGETTSTMAAASGQITGNTAARRGQGSTGPNLYYTIDARGTDPVLTEQRTKAALIAVHSSAISTSVQVQADRVRRSPQRVGG